MNFFSELKRRNVIRMAGLYLVGAWLLVQVASTLFPAFGVPGWALRALVIVLALGFSPAMVFAWVFELTPDGIKRDAEVGPGQSIAPQTAQRMNRLIIAVLMLALVYFGLDKFVLAPRREATAVALTTEAAKAEAVVVAKTAIAPGIAVLPFENLSPDPDNAFFAGGVFEEVLTKLSKVPELRVISRTSMEQIAKQHLEVTAIGKRLGVSHVLEGSVRRAGDRVRVTVQLIEAATDNHEVAVARFVTGDLEGALAVRADRHSDNPVTDAIFDAEQADLLQVVGRGDEARALAARALATIRAAIAQGQAAPSGMQAAWYATAASIAAFVGDRSTAAAWEQKAQTAPVSSLDQQQRFNRYLADLHRYLGDPEAAWRMASKSIGPQYDTSDGELLAFKLYYDKLYGQSPSYRAYTARIASQP